MCAPPHAVHINTKQRKNINEPDDTDKQNKTKQKKHAKVINTKQTNPQVLCEVFTITAAAQKSHSVWGKNDPLINSKPINNSFSESLMVDVIC